MNTDDKKRKRLIEDLKNKEYRDEYVSAGVDVGIAFQLKALREHKDMTQTELGNLANMAQARIHELEDPSKSPNLKTLKRLANAFDVGLIVRFVPISELVKWELNLSSDSHMMSLSSDATGVPGYERDPYFQEIKEDQPEVEHYLDHYGLGGQQNIYTDPLKRASMASAPTPREQKGALDDITALVKTPKRRML